MTFQVDSNTTIDGNLQVGVDADVTYRIDSGQYIAINVRVGQQQKQKTKGRMTRPTLGGPSRPHTHLEGPFFGRS